MDAILQRYILDSSIPIEKRRNMATDLDNKSIDEATAKGIVLQKYGNKYQGPQGLASSVTQSLSKMSGGGDIATPSAPSSPEISGGWNTRNTAEANKAPVVPETGLFGLPKVHVPGSNLPKSWEKAPDQQNFIDKGIAGFHQGVMTGAEGVQKIGAAVTGDTSGLEGFRQFYGITPEGQVDVKQLTPEERLNIGWSGANDAVSGTLQGAFSPATAVADVVPYGKEIMGAAGEGIKYAATNTISPAIKATLGTMGIKLSPEQEKLLDDSSVNAANLLLLKFGKDAEGFKALEKAKATALKVGDIAKYEELAAVKPTIGQNLAGNITKGAGELSAPIIDPLKNTAKAIVNPLVGAAKTVGKGVSDIVTGKTEAFPNQVFLERAARQAKIPENDIAALKNLKPEERAIADQYLKHSVEKMNDPINKKSVWTLPAKEISDFRTQAKLQLKTIGKAMEDAVNTDLKGKIVDATPVVKAFSQVLDNSNVKLIKGKLDFSGSDLAENSHAQTALTKILDSLSSNKKITGSLNDALTGTQLDARGLVSINRMMNDVAGKAESAGLGGNKLSAQLAPIKNAVEATVAPASKLYTTAKAEYANLINDLKKIDDAGKFGNKGNKGFSGQQILKRSLNTDDAKYSAAMDAIKNIESNHGIIAPKSLTTKAQLANMMEKITGTQAARSFAKAGPYAPSMAIDNVVAKVPVVGPMLRGAGELAKNANYKYFEGKIPGFKDAMGTANRAHIEAAFNLINAPEFKLIPPKVSISLLKRVAPSIPNGMIGKMSKTALEAGLVTPPAQTNKQ